MRNDFSLKAKKEEGPGYIIKFRFKFLFFMLATLAATLVLFVPAVAPLGPGALSALLMSWGIKYAVAQYATVVIAGGLVYSLRTSVVGLLLLFNKARGKSGEHQLSSSSSSTELAQPFSSTTKDYYVQLASSPAHAAEQKQKSTAIYSCPACKASLVITTDVMVEEEKNRKKESDSPKGRPLANAMDRVLRKGQDPDPGQQQLPDQQSQASETISLV